MKGLRLAWFCRLKNASSGRERRWQRIINEATAGAVRLLARPQAFGHATDALRSAPQTIDALPFPGSPACASAVFFQPAVARVHPGPDADFGLLDLGDQGIDPLVLVQRAAFTRGHCAVPAGVSMRIRPLDCILATGIASSLDSCNLPQAVGLDHVVDAAWRTSYAAAPCWHSLHYGFGCRSSTACRSCSASSCDRRRPGAPRWIPERPWRRMVVLGKFFPWSCNGRQPAAACATRDSNRPVVADV